MACFIVPATEAVITTVAKKVMDQSNHKTNESMDETTHRKHTSFKKKLGWLSNMLWGGSALLAFEHVWHGEVTPWFPFLTAAGSSESMAEMLREMSTVGVTMAVLVTAVWGCMVGITTVIENRREEMPEGEEVR